jgi:hypothetical protein
LRSDAISTTPTNSDIHPLAASVPRLCQLKLPISTHVPSVPTSLPAKPPSRFIYPSTSPSNNVPIRARNADEDLPENPTCAATAVSTTLVESKSSNVNIATSDPIDDTIWPVTTSSCITTPVCTSKSPATCQNQSHGGLLSRFLKHIRLPHTLQTRSFNLAVG